MGFSIVVSVWVYIVIELTHGEHPIAHLTILEFYVLLIIQRAIYLLLDINSKLPTKISSRSGEIDGGLAFVVQW